MGNKGAMIVFTGAMNQSIGVRTCVAFLCVCSGHLRCLFVAVGACVWCSVLLPFRFSSWPLFYLLFGLMHTSTESTMEPSFVQFDHSPHPGVPPMVSTVLLAIRSKEGMRRNRDLYQSAAKLWYSSFKRAQFPF
jgi:hypothetical protein